MEECGCACRECGEEVRREPMEGLTAVYVKPGEGNAWWEGCGGSDGREEDEGGREGWERVGVESHEGRGSYKTMELDPFLLAIL